MIREKLSSVQVKIGESESRTLNRSEGMYILYRNGAQLNQLLFIELLSIVFDIMTEPEGHIYKPSDVNRGIAVRGQVMY